MFSSLFRQKYFKMKTLLIQLKYLSLLTMHRIWPTLKLNSQKSTKFDIFNTRSKITHQYLETESSFPTEQKAIISVLCQTVVLSYLTQ